MNITTKRWNDPVDETDGFRLLICRYRPKYLPVGKEYWDDWWEFLGPSKSLHADFYGYNRPPISWEEYSIRYLKEMESQKEHIQKLAFRVKSDENITLLCSSACKDEHRCHRSLLKDLILKIDV